jgi:carbon-monoxide dehydrogenase small subunit
VSGELAFVGFVLNGIRRELHVRSDEMLIDLLRDRFGLNGTKLACDVGACGACTVLVDGRPMASCSTFAWQADGADIQTVEGLADADGTLDPVQRAFVDNSAFQCGYCTPGMILLARALLDRDPAPDRVKIRSWMSANVCRCTGYEMIVEAVEDAAGLVRAAKR